MFKNVFVISLLLLFALTHSIPKRKKSGQSHFSRSKTENHNEELKHSTTLPTTEEEKPKKKFFKKKLEGPALQRPEDENQEEEFPEEAKKYIYNFMLGAEANEMSLMSQGIHKSTYDINLEEFPEEAKKYIYNFMLGAEANELYSSVPKRARSDKQNSEDEYNENLIQYDYEYPYYYVHYNESEHKIVVRKRVSDVESNHAGYENDDHTTSAADGNGSTNTESKPHSENMTEPEVIYV